MSLHMLSSGDGLQSIDDLYGVHKSTISKTMRKFCRVVRKHMQPVSIQTPDESQFRVLTRRSEQSHDTLYIVGTMDGSHIYVQTPVVSYISSTNFFDQSTNFFKNVVEDY